MAHLGSDHEAIHGMDHRKSSSARLLEGFSNPQLWTPVTWMREEAAAFDAARGARGSLLLDAQAQQMRRFRKAPIREVSQADPREPRAETGLKAELLEALERL